MTFDDLKLFLHLTETLHFGKTSRACHVSPSTLSRVIQRLEEESHQVLFARDRRRVRLTSAGMTFQRFSEDVLSGWRHVQAELDAGAESLRGELRLYCSVTASYSILPEILTRFRPQYPEVQISLVTGDAAAVIDRVLDDSVDVTIAALPDRLPQGLDARVITTTSLLFIGPTGSGPVQNQIKGLPEWAEVPMIFPEVGLIRTYLEGWFREKGIRPRVYGQVSGHEAIISLVSLGFGVGVIPELVLEKSLIRTDVQILDVAPALPDFRVGLCVKKSKMSMPVVQALWQSLDM